MQESIFFVESAVPVALPARNPVIEGDA